MTSCNLTELSKSALTSLSFRKKGWYDQTSFLGARAGPHGSLFIPLRCIKELKQTARSLALIAIASRYTGQKNRRPALEATEHYTVSSSIFCMPFCKKCIEND